MAKLTPRYSKHELETLIGLIHPEERRCEFTREKWGGEGFRHYLIRATMLRLVRVCSPSRHRGDGIPERRCSNRPVYMAAMPTSPLQ